MPEHPEQYINSRMDKCFTQFHYLMQLIIMSTLGINTFPDSFPQSIWDLNPPYAIPFSKNMLQIDSILSHWTKRLQTVWKASKYTRENYLKQKLEILGKKEGWSYKEKSQCNRKLEIQKQQKQKS